MLGKIFEVSTVARGSYATVNHAAGATTLYVQDGSDFDDAGTLTVLDGTGAEVPVTYTRVGDVLTVAPLPVAVGEDAPVLVAPAASDMVAQVMVDPVGTEGDTEPVEAVVQHSLRAFLADGIRRTPDVQETAVVELVDGVWTVTDVPGVAPTVLASALPPLEVGPDGLAPGASPAPAVVGTVGALLVSWLPVVNHDPVTYEMHLSATSGFTPSAATLVRETAGGSAALSALPGGSPLAYGTTYYVRVVAKDGDGAAPASVEASGQMRPAGQEDISAAYAYLGHVLAAQIMSGEVSAELVLSGAIKTAIEGARVEMDATGIRVYSPDGTLVTVLGVDLRNLFAGDVEADGLVVKGRMEVQAGASASVAAGGALVLESGIQPPVTAPQVSHWWPVVATLTDEAGKVLTPVAVGTRLWSGWVSVDQQRVIRVHNASGMQVATHDPYIKWYENSGVLVISALSGASVTVRGVVMYDVDKYAMLYRDTEGAGHWWVWTTDGGSKVLSGAYEAIGVAGSLIILARHVSSKETLDFYTPATLAKTKTVTNSTVWSAGQGAIVGVAGWGAQTTQNVYLTAIAGTGLVRATLESGADGTAYEYAQASGTLVGIGQGSGGIMWSALADGRIVAHDGTTWSGAWRTQRDYAYTWTNGTAETQPGPRQTAYSLKGARTRVTTSAIPAGGGAITGVKAYASASVGGTLWLQGASSTNVVDKKTLADSGTPAPTTNTFATATPATIRNADSSLLISGDGTMRTKRLVETGRPVFVAASRESINTANNWARLILPEVLDTVNGYNPATGLFVTPEEGWWQLFGAINFAANSSGRRILQYEIGTAAAGTSNEVFGRCYMRLDTSNYAGVSWSAMTPRKLPAGSTLSLAVYQTSGGALAMRGDLATLSFAAVYLGDW